MRPAVSNVVGDDGEADPHVFQIGGMVTVVPPERARVQAPTTAAPIPPPPIQSSPVAVLPKAAATGEPISTPKLIAQLRKRLRIVDREIKARAKLEAERDQIKRLIAAAENERNNLRAIRAAG